MTLEKLFKMYKDAQLVNTDTSLILDDLRSQLTNYYSSPEGQAEAQGSVHFEEDRINNILDILLDIIKSWMRAGK